MTDQMAIELQTQVLVEDLAEGACSDLFAAYGVNIERCSVDQWPGGEGSLTGIIGFTGAGITGMVMVASSEEPLKASNPADGALRDWVAELSNQLAGRLKHKLIAQGVEVYITTPIVLRAMRIEPLPRRMIVPRAFKAAGGRVSLWVEVEIAADFVVSAPGEIPVAEGEAMLF